MRSSARFAPRVRLLALSPRRGKIAAINHGLRQRLEPRSWSSPTPTRSSSRDAIRALVRNFAIRRGRLRVSGDVALIGERALLAESEDLYYRYERWLQHAESDIGSMIGADGALYAIRRELFAPPRRRHDPRRHGDSDGRRARRAVASCSSRTRAAQEPGVEIGAWRSSARKTRVVAGAMQFLAGPTARCRSRRRR